MIEPAIGRRTLLIAFILVVFEFLPGALASGDGGQEQGTLVGLTGIRVVVEEPDDDAEHEGLTQSALQRELESRLKGAGIRLLSDREWQAAPGRPSLKLDVTIKSRAREPRLFLVELEVEQDVRLVRDAARGGRAATWSATPRLGVLPASAVAPVFQAVREAVDEFVAAWRGANPRR